MLKVLAFFAPTLEKVWVFCMCTSCPKGSLPVSTLVTALRLPLDLEVRKPRTYSSANGNILLEVRWPWAFLHLQRCGSVCSSSSRGCFKMKVRPELWTVQEAAGGCRYLFTSYGTWFGSFWSWTGLYKWGCLLASSKFSRNLRFACLKWTFCLSFSC